MFAAFFFSTSGFFPRDFNNKKKKKLFLIQVILSNMAELSMTLNLNPGSIFPNLASDQILYFFLVNQYFIYLLFCLLNIFQSQVIYLFFIFYLFKSQFYVWRSTWSCARPSKKVLCLIFIALLFVRSSGTNLSSYFCQFV